MKPYATTNDRLREESDFGDESGGDQDGGYGGSNSEMSDDDTVEERFSN